MGNLTQQTHSKEKMYAKSSFGLKLKKRMVGMIYYPNTTGKESKDTYQLIKKGSKMTKIGQKLKILLLR